jgi:hypothetical protein
VLGRADGGDAGEKESEKPIDKTKKGRRKLRRGRATGVGLPIAGECAGRLDAVVEGRDEAVGVVLRADSDGLGWW